jgi:NADH dehydrogenase
MNVFVTGASGFVGREIVKQLLSQGHQVRALIRKKDGLSGCKGVDTVIGDTTRPESLASHLKDCTAVIHLVGIIREFPGRHITFERLHTESTRNILQAAQKQGVQRYLHMSANGARINALTNYHRTKWAAEELVREAPLNWTIFRPSLIFGPQDMFVNMLVRLIKSLPIVPVMGDGHYRLQPVHVTDVAGGFVAALEAEESFGQTYCCCGPEVFTYDDILDVIGQVLGRSHVRKIHHPLSIMKPVVKIMQKLPLFPMTSDQLQMLLEGNVCADTIWAENFNLELTAFKTGIEAYLK